jgi:hypothetical protein
MSPVWGAQTASGASSKLLPEDLTTGFGFGGGVGAAREKVSLSRRLAPFSPFSREGELIQAAGTLLWGGVSGRLGKTSVSTRLALFSRAN